LNNQGIRIGFDLDGVICDISVTTLRMIDQVDEEKKLMLEKWYYKERVPLLNPNLIMANDDEAFVITARPSYLATITKQWMRKYYPGIPVIILGCKSAPKSDLRCWWKSIIDEKVKAIKKLRIDLYIDDSPEIVKELRRRGINCLQYGGLLQ